MEIMVPLFGMAQNNGRFNLSLDENIEILEKKDNQEANSGTCNELKESEKIGNYKNFSVESDPEYKNQNYKKLTEKLFNVVEDDIFKNKIFKIESSDDILRHIMEISLMNFRCCDISMMNFNEYVEHYKESHYKKLQDRNGFKNYLYKDSLFGIRKRKYSLDRSTYETKISKNKEYKQAFKFKGQDSTKKDTKKETRKSFKCRVFYCNKSYKSENGLKYHIEHGHRGLAEEFKNFVCKHDGCQKRYKNYNGLKYHLKHNHNK